MRPVKLTTKVFGMFWMQPLLRMLRSSCTFLCLHFLLLSIDSYPFNRLTGNLS